MFNHIPPPVSGFAIPGFERVRQIFAENFVRRRELGGACAVYHQGQAVVDIWGGVRNKTPASPGSTTRWWSCTLRRKGSRR